MPGVRSPRCWQLPAGPAGKITRSETGRLVSDPFHELPHPRVLADRVERMEAALQFLLGQEGMELLVTGAAEQEQLVLHRVAREVLFVPLVPVPALRNQVMPGQRRLPPAKLAGTFEHWEGGCAVLGRLRATAQPETPPRQE